MGASSFQPNPPDEPVITDYDRAHAAIYLRLLDAEINGAGWESAAALVLQQDVSSDWVGAHGLHTSHLKRAQWLRDSGFILLLRE